MGPNVLRGEGYHDLMCASKYPEAKPAPITSSFTKADSRTRQTIHVPEAAHWSLVDEALGGFHDGMVRHLRLQSSDFVGDDFKAVLEGRQVASVLVQFQWRKVPAAQLLFADVRCASFDYRRDVSAVVAEPSAAGGWKASFLSVEIEAGECWVLPLPASFIGAL